MRSVTLTTLNEQVDYGTGSPAARDQPYNTADLRRCFGDLDVLNLCADDAVLAEVAGHVGRSALALDAANRPWGGVPGRATGWSAPEPAGMARRAERLHAQRQRETELRVDPDWSEPGCASSFVPIA